MSLEKPSPEVKQAIVAAAEWLESAKLTGIRIVDKRDETTGKKDRVVVEDKTASPLWARFYVIETNKPLFCDRDGVPKATLAEIGIERRGGYAWYGNWAQKLLEQEYPAWRKKHGL